jgi:hypothetical protein
MIHCELRLNASAGSSLRRRYAAARLSRSIARGCPVVDNPEGKKTLAQIQAEHEEQVMAEALSRRAEAEANVRRRQAEIARKAAAEDALIAIARSLPAPKPETKPREGTEIAAIKKAIVKRWGGPDSVPGRLSTSDKEAIDKEVSSAGFPIGKGEYGRRARDTAFRRALQKLRQP